VHPYGNRSVRIAAIVVILLGIPSKGRRKIPRGETRLMAQQAGSKSGSPASTNRRAGGDHGLAREYGKRTTAGSYAK
jgi:hypothetical protein